MPASDMDAIFIRHGEPITQRETRETTMTAAISSFTTLLDEAQLERGMLRAVLAVLSERHDPTIDVGGRVAILRRVQAMAAAYLDLCQQLGVVVPEAVERWAEYLDALDLLATLDPAAGRH